MDTSLDGARVLVTGGTGFIGSHLTDALVELGAHPIVVDDNSRGRPENIIHRDSVELVEADLTDETVAMEWTSDVNFCFHLAAVVGDVAFMASNPHRIYENLKIDYNVLEACRQNGVKKMLYTSSACVYPTDLQEDEHALLSESQALENGANPDGDYGWTKLVGERISTSLTDTFDLPIVVARPFNPYGPGERFDEKDSHVIPAFVRRAANREDPFVVWGSGEQVRTFTYVEDLVNGMIASMRSVEGGTTVNLSTTESVTIAELARTVLDIADYDAQITFDESKPEGVKIRKPDMTKANEMLDWEPDTDIRTGIKRTYEWYVQ